MAGAGEVETDKCCHHSVPVQAVYTQGRARGRVFVGGYGHRVRVPWTRSDRGGTGAGSALGLQETRTVQRDASNRVHARQRGGEESCVCVRV